MMDIEIKPERYCSSTIANLLASPLKADVTKNGAIA
jgi:hypothetical protein